MTRRMAPSLGGILLVRVQATLWEARQWEAWHSVPQYQKLQHREQLLRAPPSASPQPAQVRAARVRMQARVRGEGSGMPTPLAATSSRQRVYRA